MITRLQKWLAKYMSHKWAYRIVFTSYTILVSIPIIILGYIFDCMVFMIISSMLVNYLRSVTYGYHTTNGKCTILTYCLLIIFGYISKTIQIEWSFLIALLSMRYIYLKAPLKLTKKNKSLQWHRSKIQLLMISYIMASLVCLYFGLNLITSSILWSINMVALTLFENIDNIEK